MADESFQEKTEAPTPRRREESHRKGQVARSQELNTAFLLLSMGGLLLALSPALTQSFATILGEGTRYAGRLSPDAASTATWVRAISLRSALAAAPLLAGLALAGGVVAAAQARGVFTFETLKLDWSRIAPHKNASRIWGVRAVAELAKQLLKVVVVGLALWLSFRRAWPEISVLAQQEPGVLGRFIGRFTVRMLLTAGAAYLVLAAADFAFQLWQHRRGLRMTKEEVRQELKETDGDPLVKSRLRSLSRALVRRQMYRDVPRADVVVTNPTHIAVALKYDPQVSPAPVVLALGQRKIAERIKRIAHEAGVPVIENKPLARALFAAGRIGLPIPAELYVAVAEVLAFVYRHRRRNPEGQGSAVA
jgi:flagellar biosynthetic protein FlhB